MKHVVLVLSILFLCATAGFANVGKGGKQINAGVGLSGWGIPIYAGIDFGVHKDVTVGGQVAFRRYKERWNDFDYKHSIIGISGNGNYHFNSLLKLSEKWDLYAGLNLGFNIWISDKAYNGSGASSLDLGLQVGGRFNFTEKFGLNLEFAGGLSTFGGKLGVTFPI